MTGNARIIQLLSNLFPVEVNPTIGPGLFSANDFVCEKIELADAVIQPSGMSTLQSLALVDFAKQEAALIIHLFGADLAGTYYGHATESISAADWLKWFGCIEIQASDYETMANASMLSFGNIGLPVKIASGTSLYALIVTTDAPTYTADCLRLVFGFERR